MKENNNAHTEKHTEKTSNSTDQKNCALDKEDINTEFCGELGGGEGCVGLPEYEEIYREMGEGGKWNR